MSNTVVYEYEDGTYERSGECCRCGECCTDGNPLDFEGEIPGACALLTLLPVGVFACKDRNHPYYLNGCNVWPTHPGQIADKPSCTYRFEKIGS